MPYFLRGRSSNGQKRRKHQIEVQPILPSNDFDFQRLLIDAEHLQQQTFLESETNDEGDAEPITQEEPDAMADPAIREESEVDEGANSKRPYEESASPAATSSQSRSHKRRRIKRDAQVIAEGHTPNAKALAALLDACTPLKTELKTVDLPATSCGTQAKHYRPDENDGGTDDLKIEELLADGYTLVSSDPRVPRPILDREKRIVGGFCGRTSDIKYLDACNRVYELFAAVGENTSLKEEAAGNRRGCFPVINIGITHGKGTSHPVNLHEGKDHPAKYEVLAQEIKQNPDLNRIATFQSSCFRIWCPKVYQYYCDKLGQLYAKLPYLKRNFSKSIFPCCAVNCGPKAWTCKHRDSMNIPFGMCAITALGKFDHTKGGHLVLPDLKLIIEFPVGCVILIPSATLVHANIPVQDHEFRASFTQFAAGGLFRYVDNGFMTEKALKKKDKKGYEEACAQKKVRWDMGLKLLSKISDIVVSK